MYLTTMKSGFDNRIISADANDLFKETVFTGSQFSTGQLHQGDNIPRLRYWCNCFGEINIPEKNKTHIGKVEELPSSIADLYRKYQSDCDGMKLYTVTFNGANGMLFTMLLDDAWVNDIGAENNLYDCMRYAIDRIIEENKLPAFVDVLLMINTDPDGSEIGFFFHSSVCHNVLTFKEKAGELSNIIYSYIENASDILSGAICLCSEKRSDQPLTIGHINQVRFEKAYPHNSPQQYVALFDERDLAQNDVVRIINSDEYDERLIIITEKQFKTVFRSIK